MKRLRYRYGTQSEFYLSVRQQVDEYFEKNQISRHANAKMIFKSVFFLCGYIIPYFLILSDEFSAITMLFFVIIMGLFYPGILINICHDASHNAYSKNRKLNKFLLSTLPIMGMNAYIFELLHIKAHHVYTSIEGEDVILEENSIIRLSKNQRYQNIHKYQSLYAPFVYLFYAIFLIFPTDFALFKRKKMGALQNVQHMKYQIIKFYIEKILYLFFLLILPLIFVSLPWWKVILGFFIMHGVGSMILFVIGLLNHQINESIFPEPDHEGYINNNKKNHELAVTIDFSPQSKIASFIFGSFNNHVAHHLFPHICHIHYPIITKLIKITAPKYGLEYKSQSLWQAILSHFRYLRRLSKDSTVNIHIPINHGKPPVN